MHSYHCGVPDQMALQIRWSIIELPFTLIIGGWLTENDLWC